VDGLSRATFLLRFSSSAIKNTALLARSFAVGNCVLNVMPWSRRIGASIGKLRFRARVCLEGVPWHARSAAAVAQLFASPSFIDEINCPVEKEEERFCFNVWIWIAAPSEMTIKGTLQLEELRVPSDDHGFTLRSMAVPPFRDEPAATFDYNVLIHLDRVLDYSSPVASPGIPGDESPEQDFPACYNYTWHLGLVDRERSLRRTLVHERLGERGGRQDQPPPQGDGGSSGLHQHEGMDGQESLLGEQLVREVNHDGGLALECTNHGAAGAGGFRDRVEVEVQAFTSGQLMVVLEQQEAQRSPGLGPSFDLNVGLEEAQVEAG
jgi:hypothetical protein